MHPPYAIVNIIQLIMTRIEHVIDLQIRNILRLNQRHHNKRKTTIILYLFNHLHNEAGLQP